MEGGRARRRRYLRRDERAPDALSLGPAVDRARRAGGVVRSVRGGMVRNEGVPRRALIVGLHELDVMIALVDEAEEQADRVGDRREVRAVRAAAEQQEKRERAAHGHIPVMLAVSW